MDGIANWILNIPEKSMGTKIISCGYEGRSETFNVSGELYGGVFFLIGFRTGTYAGITAYSYWRARVISVAAIENGAWAKRFEKVITNNDFRYKDVSLDVISGDTDISNSEITGFDWFPIVLRVSSSYEGIGIYGRLNTNKWVVHSNVAQNITIRFFKYPKT